VEVAKFLNNNVRSDDIFVFDTKSYPGVHFSYVFAFLFPKNRQIDIDTFINTSKKVPVNFWLVAIPDEILQHDANLRSCSTFQIHELYRYDVFKSIEHHGYTKNMVVILR
jgi:hypothetical protein